MTVSIRLTNDLGGCLAIRRAVFIVEQGVSEADEVDGLDGDALHLLATVDGKNIGTARILTKAGVMKVGRVAVLAAHRGQGHGAALIRAALDAARQTEGVSRVVLGAQTHAIAFYEALGFTAFGKVYDDAGIPHRDMEYRI